tara:strand:- start:3018 stop:3899 length:882 start_codon:yes stop_codon:yes gene_type:complete
MEKVVVFGGSGFIGSHVADELTNKGYKVLIFDSSKSPYLNSNQEMMVGSILDKKKLDEAIKGSKYVYHFAAIADIKESSIDPVNTIEINVLGTCYILDLCVKHGVQKFLYASTVYVYSNHGSFYRTSKQASELIIENYSKSYNLQCVLLRYGSLYGKRANHFNSITKMIKQAIQEKKIVRSGTGEEIRDYINVKDAAKTSVDLLKLKELTNHVMITGNQTMKIKDLLKMINEMFNNELDIEYTNKSNEEHYEITPYNFKPNVALKFTPEHYHDLGQGILESIYDTFKELNVKK